ncbi:MULTISPECIES: phage shock protein PspA [Kordiimonas]|jgi:phage shock protein A|uniref:Phage shock protein A (PspA) family protein n=1 Tax=Kordiimonas lacus TaxID=637679 RepID=A0A1G7E7M2_9PROT|nr:MULTISPECIES: phage shock protein PspA [Kordiimonas]SDE59663.1 phage shock protein A (PspA) family protein [Kordiimonas lacus]
MGIFSRLTDIINSNINAILDKAEDPEKIIRMVIQEMEDTLVEVRSSAAKTIADQKDLERRIKKVKQATTDWEKKAELAISKGRDDLAKGALIEKAKVADMAAHLEEEMKHLSEALGRNEEDVIKLEAKLREARAKKASMTARHKSASNQVRVRKNLYDNRIQDAFDRFDKVDARLDRLEGEAEAMAIGRGENLEDAFKELESNDEIEQELAALKAKAAGTTSAKAPAKKSASK